MRTSRRLVLPAVATLIAIVAAACGAASPTGAPSPTATQPPPTPVGASPTTQPSGAPSEGGYWLRMTTSQAIPPLDRFPVGPTSLITADGEYLVPGAVPAIYPGPLVMPYFARQVSDAGRAEIVRWARDLGLLDGPTDFTGGNLMPGGITGQLELTVDGALVTLTGVPGLPTDGNPAPGSPEAFAELWRRVESLPETLPGELGPERPYEPGSYALLVGPPPAPDAGIPGNLMDWPLDVPLATFGEPVAEGYRCGLVEGEDAATLAPSLNQANQLTQWLQDPDTSATFGLTVRIIVPGEDPCEEVFGA